MKRGPNPKVSADPVTAPTIKMTASNSHGLKLVPLMEPRSEGTVESLSCRESANGLVVLSVLVKTGQKTDGHDQPATISPRTSSVISQKPVSADFAARHAAMTRVSSP